MMRTIERGDERDPGGMELVLERMRRGAARVKQHAVCETCRRNPSAIARATAAGVVRALCRSCAGRPAPAATPRPAPRTAPAQAAPPIPAPALRRARAEITGYIVVWGDTVRRDVGDRNHCGVAWSYSEAFAPGAFRDFLAGAPNVLARLNHRDTIGSTRAGNLRLFENDHGLAFTLTPDDTDAGERAILCAGAGSIHGCSPTWVRHSCTIQGQQYRGADYTWASPGMRERLITRSELVEVSLVTGNDEPSFRMGWAAIATPTAVRRLQAEAAAARGAARA